MRTLALVFSTIFATLTAIPAAAQTFGGNAPICLEKWGWGGIHNISCSYNSMAQCQATASGLSAMCRTNPYYSNAQAPRRGTTLRRGY